MNSVCVVGRFTKDPDVRYKDELAIARFSVAVPRPKQRDKEATSDFPSCIAFGKQAEFIEKYITKGRLVAITGRIQTGNYTDKDGRKVYTTDIVVETIEPLDKKPETTGAKTEEQTSFESNIPQGFEKLSDDIPF